MTGTARKRIGLAAWHVLIAGCLCSLGMAGALLASPGEATAEVTRKGSLVISFGGQVEPAALPRNSPMPVRAGFSGQVRNATGGNLPTLERLMIEVNRHALVETRGLARCHVRQIRSARSPEALRNCGDALVGRGTFGIELAFPDQERTPSRGRVLIFNARFRGAPAVLLHVHAQRPAPVAMVVPLRMSRRKSGSYGLVLSSPRLPAIWGPHIRTTAFSFDLGRRFAARGRAQSYLRAACPAPDGFPGAVFSLARATYRFTGGATVRQVLTRSCRVRG